MTSPITEELGSSQAESATRALSTRALKEVRTFRLGVDSTLNACLSAFSATLRWSAAMASAFSVLWMALTIVKLSRTPTSREMRLAVRMRVTVRDPEEMRRRAYLK
jgi:hypothetical protein